MTAVSEIGVPANVVLMPALLANVRNEAGHGKRRSLEDLAEQQALPVDEFIRALREALHLPGELKELIVTRRPIRSIRKAARTVGTLYLREESIALVCTGKPAVMEINRVTCVA